MTDPLFPRLADAGVGPMPLYAQVRLQLMRRLISGEWAPGALLPSEQEIARQMGVSQGTVRKALDALTAEHLLVRRQGRGTFVAEPDAPRLLFKFFRVVADGDTPALPESVVHDVSRQPAPEEVAEALALAPGGAALRIDRTRRLGGRATINETLWLPEARFPGLLDEAEIPNNLYQLLSLRWGVTIGRADEQVRATPANADDVMRLDCPLGQPLLAIRRVAFDLEDQPVELRLSRCLTDEAHYGLTLG